MRSDSKHQFGAQIILNCAVGEKNSNKQEEGMLSNHLSSLVTKNNGNSNDDHDSVNISASMLAHNLVRLSQDSALNDSSSLHSPSNERTNGIDNNDVSDFSSHSAEANYD